MYNIENAYTKDIYSIYNILVKYISYADFHRNIIL